VLIPEREDKNQKATTHNKTITAKNLAESSNDTTKTIIQESILSQ
jgi:hypothetical protein